MYQSAVSSLGFLHFKALFIAGSLTFFAGCQDASRPSASVASLQNSVVSTAEMPSQDFAEWCREWEVDCFTRRYSNTVEAKVDETLRKTFNNIFIEFLQSASEFTVSRDDLDSLDLRQGLKVLSIDTLLNPLAHQLDRIGWQKATLLGSALTLESNGGGWLDSKSGVQLGVSASSQFRFLGGDRIETSGISLGTALGQKNSELLALQYFPGETLTLELSDRRVEQVPAWFIGQLLGEVFGADEAGLFADKKLQKLEVIQGLYPLLKWLNQPFRVLSLSQSFFRKAADQLAALPEADPALINILRSIQRLESSAKKNQNVLTVTQTPRTALRCDVNNDDLILSFDASFGLKSFYQTENDGIGLEFYGVKASSKKVFGAFTVKRIEFTPESYSILDIPIIRKFDIRWDSFEQQAGDKTVMTSCKNDNEWNL